MRKRCSPTTSALRTSAPRRRSAAEFRPETRRVNRSGVDEDLYRRRACEHAPRGRLQRSRELGRLISRRRRGEDRRRRARLDALQLERAAERLAAVLDRHHRGERLRADAAAGTAARHRRLVADLPARRHDRRRGARRLLRHDDVRDHAGDRRRERSILWKWTPPGYRGWAGSYRITTATPVADPSRHWIYAASPDGRIQKLSVADGHAAWRVSITKLPQREKIASSLNFANGHVIATTGGYIGDQPPYQGHVAIIDAASGQLLHVWNSLCSNRHGLIAPSSCASSDSAIWGRAGAVVVPGSGNLLVATGNGPWNGSTDWGDSTLLLTPSATKLIGNYTPTNTAQLNATDLDLGSTSPVLLTSSLVAQGGKDGKIRLLSMKRLRGTAPHKGGELQSVSTPSGTDLFTAPAVWRTKTGVWMFAADGRRHRGLDAEGKQAAPGLAQRERRHEPDRRRRPALGLRPERRPACLRAGDREARDDAPGRARPLEQPDRRRRPSRAPRGQRERPQDERRARHLALRADFGRYVRSRGSSRGCQWPKGREGALVVRLAALRVLAPRIGRRGRAGLSK